MEKNILTSISRAIKEDRIHHDVTTQLLVPTKHISEAEIVAKEETVVCGTDLVKNIFHRLDPKMKISILQKDGNLVKRHQKIVHLKGKTRAILSGERIALNYIAYLSGIAYLTNQFVLRARPHKPKIMDTRKTIPGLRALVKMAVRTGGGVNHRFNLKEMVMIKDNHQMAYCNKERSIERAIKRIRSKTNHLIVVEVDTLVQFKQALKAHPDIILLDNMPPRRLKKAVEINKKAKKPCLLEASGGINLRNIKAFAKTGVDRISIGALTHSPQASDYSMEFKKR